MVCIKSVIKRRFNGWLLECAYSRARLIPASARKAKAGMVHLLADERGVCR